MRDEDVELEPGQVVSSDFVAQPGLIDKLVLVQEAGIADDDPALPSWVPAEEFLSFSYQTHLSWSEDTEKILVGEVPYAMLVEQGLLRRVWDRFTGKKFLGEEESTAHVPILALHRPRVDDCTAEFKLSMSSKSDFSFKVSVLGSGGGHGGTKSFATRSGYKTDKDCIEYWVPVKTRTRVYQRNDGRQFQITDVVDILNHHRVTRTPRHQDECGRSRSPVRDLHGHEQEFDISASGVFTHEIEAATGTQANWGVSIKPSLPVLGESEIGLSGSVESLKTITFTYELVGIRTYTACEMPEEIGFSWRWTPER